MKEAAILFPHQLFEEHDIYQLKVPIYLVEEHLFFKQFHFHKLKLAFHRSSMKCHYDYLTAKGIAVSYIESTNDLSDVRNLLKHISQVENIEKIHLINPTDNWLEKRIGEATEEHSLSVKEYENPLFLNDRESLSYFFKESKKSFFQTTFYKQERKKRRILIEDNQEPVGGKWTFDKENRKKYPKNKKPPQISIAQSSDYWEEALIYTKANFKDNPGSLKESPPYPINHESTLNWLDNFLNSRFEEFGDYEDAIVAEELTLHHSVITPMLNCGLINPEVVIKKTVDFAQNNNTRLNSVEGFIRQIIGWREFIRGMYECKGSYARTKNFWGFDRKIPSSFYNGTTGIEPIDITIKKVLDNGYCHHIERLMVLGNFMLLCEFDPDEVYRWFMELFIDSYDWVMVPNVYGMSQFADGGLFATKPYISSSNYLMKMSNYKKGEWQEVWDGLFWRFMNVHRDFLKGNPRLSMLIGVYDKMDAQRQNGLIDKAEKFLHDLSK